MMIWWYKMHHHRHQNGMV